jgi:hypothetical protein
MKLRNKVWITAALATTLWGSQGVSGTPCPNYPGPDGPFNYERDAVNCLMGQIEGPPVGARMHKIYNVYCPGRMTTGDARRLAFDMASGAVRPSGVDIRPNFNRLELRPVPWSNNLVLHRFEYGCTRDGRQTVGTHVKLKFYPDPRHPDAAHHARYCKDIGSQNGNITVGTRMDREYRCALEFWGLPVSGSSESAKAQETARIILQRDFAAEARSKNARVCLLGSTDVQCAPCSHTNKLIVRVQTVKKGAICPAGSLGWVE